MEGTAASAAGYEFTPAQNEELSGAARWVGFWSWVSMLTGVVWGVGGMLTSDPSGLVMGPVYLVVGVYFRGAAGSLRSVVRTEGDDVAHLMTAMGKLTRAFKIMGLLVIAGAVIGFVAGFMGAMAAS